METLTYKQMKKMGVGGFLCTCCNPWYYDPKHGKPVMHRWLRRKNKQQDNVMEADTDGRGTREDFRSRG